REIRDRGCVGPAWIAGPPKRVDLVDRPLEVNRQLDLADIDNLLERDVEIGLPSVDDPHVRLRRNEDALGGLGWALEDLAHAPQVGVARLHGVADLYDPLDYRHRLTPTSMEWRVF